MPREAKLLDGVFLAVRRSKLKDAYDLTTMSVHESGRSPRGVTGRDSP
jgi:hypothetical protein